MTTKAIVKDIGDKKFAVLVDEAQDACIKEQMAVALRLVCHELIFIAFFVMNYAHIFFLISSRYLNSQGEVIERFV